SPPGLLAQVASGGLGPGPATRSRGTYPHLSRGMAFWSGPCARSVTPSWRTVIRITNQVDLAVPASAAWVAEVFGQQPLQSIQGSVRQGGGDDAPLRCPFRGGEQGVLLQVRDPARNSYPRFLVTNGS